MRSDFGNLNWLIHILAICVTIHIYLVLSTGHEEENSGTSTKPNESIKNKNKAAKTSERKGEKITKTNVRKEGKNNKRQMPGRNFVVGCRGAHGTHQRKTYAWP